MRPTSARSSTRSLGGLVAVATLLASGLGAGGCSVDATGLHATLSIAHCPATDRIEVTVIRDGKTIGSGSYTGNVTGGSTFGVRLPDSLDGVSVTLQVDAFAGANRIATTSKMVTVAKQQAVPVTIALECAVDGGGNDDMGGGPGPDIAMTPPDLLGIDGPLPDLTVNPGMPDIAMTLDGPQAMPDLNGGDMEPLADLANCANSYTNNITITCVNGQPKPIVCTFGCAGAICAGPNSCAGAGDISAGGVITASTAASGDNGAGSCHMVGGPDNTLKFTKNTFFNVTMTLNADFSATLFTRLTCSDAASELPMNGFCANKQAPANACQTGANTITQTLCGLPPTNVYYPFVDAPLGGGGGYTLTTTFTSVDLNDCNNAGMLIPPTATVMGDTSKQQKKMQAPVNTANCGDLGVNSPEAVFWLPVTVPNKLFNFTVTGLNGFQPLVYLQQNCIQNALATMCYPAVNGVSSGGINNIMPGSWFIIVDGQNGQSGQFTLTATLK